MSEDLALDQSINARLSGDDEHFKVWLYFQAQTDPLTINSSKRNIFFFFNVAWAVGLIELSAVHDDVLQ